MLNMQLIKTIYLLYFEYFQATTKSGNHSLTTRDKNMVFVFQHDQELLILSLRHWQPVQI